MDYSSLTDILNSRILGDQKNWVNIVGGLEKVMESSMGAVWGIKSGQLYSCLSPCNGQWILQEFPEASSDFKVLDFTTDDTNVYILWNTVDKLGNNNTGFMSKNGNNSGEWSRANLSPDLKQIFNTSSYIWGQNGAQKYKLAKPGTTGNWIQVTDASGNKITSASLNNLYGIDSAGKAYKTDESLNSAWSLIPQFKGVYTGILSNQDKEIYGIDISNKLEKCIDNNCSTLETPPVQTLNINPNSLWMTSQTQGSLGNIYFKDQKQSNILDDVKPIDKERDSLVEKAEKDYQTSTYSSIMSKQLGIIQKMFVELLDEKKVDTTPLEKDVNEKTQRSQLIERALPILIQILILLCIVISVYLCYGILGFTTHYIAFIIFGGGIYYIISNGM